MNISLRLRSRLASFALALAATLALVPAASAAPLKIAYSDWPGWTAFEVGIQKGWFKEAGVEVEFLWFDYLPSLDAFAAGKVDAVMVTNGDGLVSGANGAKSKYILAMDYSDGNDKIVAKPGIRSIAQLKGKTIGLELNLVEHLLLLKALEKNGLTPDDVKLVNFPTNETPQALASGQVDAVAAWYPVSSQILTAVPGSRAIFTSADAPGLIYDVLAVSPQSLAAHKADWAKVAQVWYRISDYVRDPATRADAAAIMAAKVGTSAAEYLKNLDGTRFLSLAEAKKAFRAGAGLDSLHGSTAVADGFNVANKVYAESQKPADYIDASVLEALK